MRSKRSIEARFYFLKKKDNIPVKKTFWPTFPVLSSIAHLRDHLKSVHKIFFLWNYGNYCGIVELWLLITQSLEKNTMFLVEKLAVLSNYRIRQTSGNTLSGSTRYFSNHCA